VSAEPRAQGADREDGWDRLREHGQEHLLRFWEALNASERQQLTRQIADLDLAMIGRLFKGHEDHLDWEEVAARSELPPAFRLRSDANRFSRQEAWAAADEVLAAGKLGVILVAGGQGTRLGFPHPKGMYPLGPVSQRTLFQMHIEQLRAVADRYRVHLPLYLMTSPATHEETVTFLSQHQRFGLPAEDLRIFCQGTMPAVDDAGRLLLADKSQVALSPDGHGGMLAAFDRGGCLQDAQQRGLEQLFYFQVDNPLVRICDRELVGYHVLCQSEMSTQVVAKKQPDDKVGNVVSVDGRLMVVEYSDLPRQAGEQRLPDGSLRLWAGSIAIHVFQLEFLRRAAQADDALPFHRARKKVPFIDETGRQVSPDRPNATKFERFIFDLMPLAHNAIVVEADESEVFAPLKNASGAEKDSPEASRAAIVDRAVRWLRSAGAAVDPDLAVEISPWLALDADQLKQKIQPGFRITRDTYLS